MNATIAIKLTDKSMLTVAPIQLFQKEMLNACRAKATACGRLRIEKRALIVNPAL